MSWFKRRGDRKPHEPVVTQLHSPAADTNMKLEVFQNHWKQAWMVISCQDKKAVTLSGQATGDGVEAVLCHIEQMVTLLVGEEAAAGLPGPILQFVLGREILEKFCSWCTINISAHQRLWMLQLRLFELLISQSKQILLVHRAVIKPLLRLLIDVSESPDICTGELEFRLVLVLHQICICISQQSLILESFFSTDTDNGPARFLTFSLLIPYIHREGDIGPKARDALLLIMTLSARHPHIGQYFANSSDFCPMLVTGLSGLYSSLPRRIIPPSQDWHAITQDDCVRIPDLQMFLNSLQFSNAVIQVAHPLVRRQLIHFIYSGFLVPVLAPALHQISREGVTTATAYLDLFIRHVTDPFFLKAVLKFVLMERYDDVLILDSLLSRISSNSQLSTVTLALFHTLVNLNCEDVMFQLVFRYLVPCTHVMVSQRNSVGDLDMYSKPAEKFLSLRPSCCSQAPPPNPAPYTARPTHLDTTSSPSPEQRKLSSAGSPETGVSLPEEAAAVGSQLEHLGYCEYLQESRNKLEQAAKACHHWTYTYDGENPPPDSIGTSDKLTMPADRPKSGLYQVIASNGNQNSSAAVQISSILHWPEVGKENAINGGKSSKNEATFDQKPADIKMKDWVVMTRDRCNNELQDRCNNELQDRCNNELQDRYREELAPHLLASLESLDSFMDYLNQLDVPGEEGSTLDTQSGDEDIAALENLLRSITSTLSHRTPGSALDHEDISGPFFSLNNEFSSICKEIKQQSCPTDTTQQPCPTDTTQQPCPTDTTQQPCPTDTTQQPCPTDTTQQPCPTDTTQQSCPTDTTQQPCPTDTTQQPCPTDTTQQPGPTDTTQQPGPKDTTQQLSPKDTTQQLSPKDSTQQPCPKDTTQQLSPKDSTQQPCPKDTRQQPCPTDTTFQPPLNHSNPSQHNRPSVQPDASNPSQHNHPSVQPDASNPSQHNRPSVQPDARNPASPESDSLFQKHSSKKKISFHPLVTSFADTTRVPDGSMAESGGPSVQAGQQVNKRPDSSRPPNVCLSSSSIKATEIKEHTLPKEFSAARRSNLAQMKAPMSPFKSLLLHEDEFSTTALSSPAMKKMKYFNDPPNIGPFLGALFARLEGMIGNPLYFNLLLTDLLSRLAAYPQPLLRSFLFSHNLVFQPSVKSFIQVLSSLRQKLDSFSLTVKHFDCLVVNARQKLVQRENQFQKMLKQQTSPVSVVSNVPKPAEDSNRAGQPVKGRRKLTLGDLIFRRSASSEKVPFGKRRGSTRQQPVKDVQGGQQTKTNVGSALPSNNLAEETSNLHSLSTWNAVYCALILDEFLKELAALSQEHSILHVHGKF